MTNYDDFFDFEDCEYDIDELDRFVSDGFDQDNPYSEYVAMLKNDGLSDTEITEAVNEVEKNLEWGTKLALVKYMQSELHEKHEMHKALAGIIAQLNGVYKNTLNLEHALNDMRDTIAWQAGSVAESIDNLNDED